MFSNVALGTLIKQLETFAKVCAVYGTSVVATPNYRHCKPLDYRMLILLNIILYDVTILSFTVEDNAPLFKCF